MKQFICIGCPRGCHVQIDEQTLQTTGNACPRGEEYVRGELTHPSRMLTGTVAIRGAAIACCPVRTDRAIAKDRLLEAAHALDTLCIEAPVHVGDVVCEDFLGTGANLIATRSLARQTQ